MHCRRFAQTDILSLGESLFAKSRKTGVTLEPINMFMTESILELIVLFLTTWAWQRPKGRGQSGRLS